MAISQKKRSLCVWTDQKETKFMPKYPVKRVRGRKMMVARVRRRLRRRNGLGSPNARLSTGADAHHFVHVIRSHLKYKLIKFSAMLENMSKDTRM